MKKMKIIYILIALVILSNSHAQMIYWTTPPFTLNTSTSTPTSSALLGTGGAYSVANGAYDHNGNLLFYVRDYGIYGPTGSLVGSLAPYNSQICDEEFGLLCSEVAIVPIPGTCKQFYVIYSMDNPVGNSPVLYVKVNCSGATPVVTYNGSVYVNCPPMFTGYKNQAFVVTGHGGTDHTAFAVSKVYTGSGSTAKRFLFSVSYGQIVRSDITSTGISAGTTVVTNATLGIANADAFECELSWGSNFLAWSSNNGTVHVIGVNGTGGYTGLSQNYNIAGCRGLEFNNASSNPKLYVSSAAGLRQILTATQTLSTIATPGYNFTNTFLEYGKNNKIYGISPTFSGSTLTATTFAGITTSNNTITSYNPGMVDSRYNILNYFQQYQCFTLPNQIDGENYIYLNGIPAVNITNFTLNGSVPPGNCDEGGMGNYCQNSPITFNATYSGGTPSKYKFDIQAVNNGCILKTGTGYVNYHSNWTNGTPPTNLDLRTLTDGAGINLGNCLSGLVQVMYSIEDACGYVSTYTRWINIYVPVPPLISLQIYNKNSPQNYLPVSQNIASPVQVGTASLGYRVNNSTGTITSLTVLIEEVTNTGAFVKQIYNRTTTVNGVSGLTYENLNNYCINTTVWGFNPGFGNCNVGYSGYTGYFSYTNGQLSYGRYFKLTVTVGNICGSSTNWSYIYVNSIGNRMASPQANNIEDVQYIMVYPNPATNLLTVEFDNASADFFQINLTDLLGREVLNLMPYTKIEKGLFKQSYDISQLAQGMYYYNIKSSTTPKEGIITKN